MPQKRRRDNVEFLGETYRPPGSPALELNDSNRQPLFPSLKTARTSLFPEGYRGAAGRPAVPSQTLSPETTQTYQSKTYPTPPTEPYHHSPPPDPEFTSALASALPTNTSSPNYTPLANLLVTQAITTPQRTLIHYYSATSPEFAFHLDAAVVRAEQDPMSKSARTKSWPGARSMSGTCTARRGRGGGPSILRG